MVALRGGSRQYVSMDARRQIDQIFESGIDHDLIVGWPDLVEKAEKLFQRAASAWERGNNRGGDNPGYYQKMLAKQSELHREAEALLAPLGIECDYPGLYPSFTVGGYSYHDTRSAVRAALDMKAGAGAFKKAAAPAEQKPLRNMIQSRRDHPLPGDGE